MQHLALKRRRKLLTAREVARALGIHYTLLSKWERGHRKPSAEQLRRWRKALR